ncbi:MAG: two pore domain potassium channel family protein [Deltaproteobacteria bacterium]|nr:two pore domain potassium channel family protein [Candidatus Tharpella sp.]
MNIGKIIRFRFRFQNLLVWIFLYIVVGPFLKAAVPHAGLIVQALFTAVLFSAVYTIHKEGRIMLPAIVLLALSSLLLWGNTLGLFHISGVAINALLVLYLALLVFSFSRHVFTTKKVDTELISAALCLYLLLGLFWGALLMLLEECIPGSFAGLDQITVFEELATRFYYFSFVTMTTLGYGDITPQTPPSMALCQAEAILGQFFTVVLVARLVGIQVAQELTKKK